MAKTIQTPGVLTKRQEQVKRFIKAFIAKNGYSPSYADIAGKLGIQITAASYHVGALAKKGHVSKVPGVSRSLRVVQ